MKFVKMTTILLSLIALLTGAMDVIVGVAGQANIGVGSVAAVDHSLGQDGFRGFGHVSLDPGSLLLVSTWRPPNGELTVAEG